MIDERGFMKSDYIKEDSQLKTGLIIIVNFIYVNYNFDIYLTEQKIPINFLSRSIFQKFTLFC